MNQALDIGRGAANDDESRLRQDRDQTCHGYGGDIRRGYRERRLERDGALVGVVKGPVAGVLVMGLSAWKMSSGVAMLKGVVMPIDIRLMHVLGRHQRQNADEGGQRQ